MQSSDCDMAASPDAAAAATSGAAATAGDATTVAATAAAVSTTTAASTMEAFKDSSVMVAVRIRPFNEREKSMGAVDVVTVTGPQSVHMEDDPSTKQEDTRDFGFDRVMPLSSTQLQMYENTGCVVLDRVLAGYNACIFAYGQTGSGKTYSMMGAGTPDSEGIIPRMCRDMFSRMNEMYATKKLRCLVEATFVEIYMEKLTDLWDRDGDGSPDVVGEGGAATPSKAAASSRAPTGPVIRQLPSGEIVLEGASRGAVSSYDALAKLLEEGNKRRAVAATKMNATSSRSHSVLT
ncbi:hypothetical protein EON62_03440, partial [archaeon]